MKRTIEQLTAALEQEAAELDRIEWCAMKGAGITPYLDKKCRRLRKAIAELEATVAKIKKAKQSPTQLSFPVEG